MPDTRRDMHPVVVLTAACFGLLAAPSLRADPTSESQAPDTPSAAVAERATGERTGDSITVGPSGITGVSSYSATSGIKNVYRSRNRAASAFRLELVEESRR